MASEKLTLGRMRTGHVFRQVQRSAYSDEEIPDPPGVQLDVDGRSVSRGEDVQFRPDRFVNCLKAGGGGYLFGQL